jgi:hypothetical protein
MNCLRESTCNLHTRGEETPGLCLLLPPLVLQIWHHHCTHRDLFPHAYLAEVGLHACAHLPDYCLCRLGLERPLSGVELVPDRAVGRQVKGELLCPWSTSLPIPTHQPSQPPDRLFLSPVLASRGWHPALCLT